MHECFGLVALKLSWVLWIALEVPPLQYRPVNSVEVSEINR